MVERDATAVTSEAASNPSADQSPPSRGLRPRLARGVAGFLWACLAVAAAWSLFAWLFPQNLRQAHAPLVLLNGVAFAGQVLRFHLAICCGVAVLLALPIRRWKLAAASAAVGLVLAAPTGLAWLPKSPPPPAAGPTLRVQTMNLLFSNYDAADIFAALDAADADVIVLQEFQDWHERFVTDHLAARYPYSTRFPDADTRGMAVFSKRPLVDATPGGELLAVGRSGLRAQRAVVELGGRPLAIWNVHPTSPGGLRSFAWGQRQAADLADALADESLPHVVAGDFNAATGTANLQAFLDLGLQEAQATAGVGPGWTWPRQRRGRVLKWFAELPGLRIDQCFFSPELTVTRAAVGPYHGSDHLGVIADLAWRK